MGAENFTMLKIGVFKTAKDAFNEAVDDALYEHGHDSYNGTISTTELTRVITDAPRPNTKAWNALIDKLEREVPKWECIAIEIPKGKAFKKLKLSRYGNKIKKNLKAYVFIGCASC